MPSSIFSRKVDSPGKKQAVALGFAILFATLITRCYLERNAVQTLAQLDASQVAEIQIAGELFTDGTSVHSIVDALNVSQRYSFQNEGCIPPYQMRIKLRSNQEMVYAIGKSRKADVILIQTNGDPLPTCLTGTIVSSGRLASTLKELNFNVSN